MRESAWRRLCSSIFLALICILHSNQVSAQQTWIGFQRFFYNCSAAPGSVIIVPCDANKNGQIDSWEQICVKCDSNRNGKVDPWEKIHCALIPHNTSTKPESEVESDWERPSMAVMINAIVNSPSNKTQDLYRVQKLRSEELRLISTSFSIVGSLFIIMSFLLLKEIRTMAFSIIFFLSVVDFLGSVATVVGTVTYAVHPISADPTYVCIMESCVVAAAFKMYFQLCSMLWSWVIATNMLLVVVIKIHIKTLKAWQTVYHVVTWVLSLVGTICAVSLKALGDSGYRCGIVRSPMGTNVEIAFIMVPMCGIFVFNVVCFVLVISCFRLSYASAQRKRIAYKLSLYALVFLVVRLPSVLSYFVMPAADNTPVTKLSSLQLAVLYSEAVIAPLQGFGDGLVYGLSKQVIKTYKEKWLKYCSIKRHGAESPECISLMPKNRFGWRKSKTPHSDSGESTGFDGGESDETRQDGDRKRCPSRGDGRTSVSPEDAENPSTDFLREPLCGLDANIEYQRAPSVAGSSLSQHLDQTVSINVPVLESQNNKTSEVLQIGTNA